jgi:hypothetical protein
MHTQGLFDEELVVVNIGLELFADSFESQEVKTIRVDWRPPAGGDKELSKLLEALL